MAEFTYNRIDPNSISAPTTSNDYSTSVNPNTILRDPRLLNDLREQYRTDGGEFMTDEELIDRFYSDQTWGTLNTVSAVRDAAEAMSAGQEEKQRLNRLQNVYNQLPNFWQEGGRGVGAALADGIPAVLADPINLIPGVNAYAKATNAARAASALGGNAVRAGIGAGARAGATSEALISGAQEGIVNTANQVRDVQLGLRDEFSLGELGASTAIGAGVGGAVGGLIGAPVGLAGARQGVRQADAGRFTGMAPEQIARMTSQEAEQVVQQANSVAGPYQSPEARAQQQAEAEAAEADAQTTDAEQPDEIEREFAGAGEALEAQIEANRRRVERLKTDMADAGIIDEAEKRLFETARLRGVIQRLRREQTEISELGETSDVKTLRTRDQRLRIFERDLTSLRALIRQTDTLDPDELAARIDEIEERAREASEAAAQGQVQDQAEEAVEETVATETDETPVAETPTEEAPAPAADEAPEAPAPDSLDAPVFRVSDDAGNRYDAYVVSGPGEPKVYSVVMPDGSQFTMPASEVKTPRRTKKTVRDLFPEEQAETTTPEPTAEAAPEATPEAAPEAPSELPPIEAGLRGEALYKGLDWRTVQPSAKAKDGRLTKRNVRSAINKRGDAEPDAYAAQAQRELGEILDLFGDADIDPQTARDAIRLMSQNPDFQTDADDLVSLFDYIDFASREADSVQSRMAESFTKTETKKIKTLARQLRKQNPEFTVDTATSIAQAQIVAQRGQDTTPVRGTGEKIEEAAQMTTAGRTNTGRIQGFLKRGTRIAKGSDYTYTGEKIKPNEFGFQAALAKARQGRDEALTGRELEQAQKRYDSMVAKGMDEEKARKISGLARGERSAPDIVAFTLDKGMDVYTRGGKVRLKKGSTAYADGITGRAYDSMELAVAMRDGGSVRTPVDTKKVDTPTAQSGEDFGELVTRYMNEGDAEGFRRALEALRKGEDVAPEARSPGVAEAEKLPLTRGDKLLIARSKSDPSDVRMISPKQAQSGKDISAIIGRKGAKSDPANWEVKYAPRERFTANDAELAALFDALPDEDPNITPSGGRYEAGEATGMGQPLTPEQAKDVKFSLTDLSREEQKALTFALGSVPQQADLSHIFMGTTRLESASWRKNVSGHRAIVESLRQLYAVADRYAPQGVLRSEASRADAVRDIEGIFSAYSSDELVQARNFIERLGGDPNIGPAIGTNSRGEFHLSTSIEGGTRMTDEISFSTNANSGTQPALNVLYHEVGHWAYFNILTPKDRLDFWNMAAKHYDAKGEMDMGNLRKFLPSYSGMETPFGEMITNRTDSPQELFASQFEMWVTRTQSPDKFTDEGFWSRIGKFVKAIFDRYMRGAQIDPDLEPLFSKILPPKERENFKLGVDATPATEAGKAYQKRYVELRFLRGDLEEAFERDNADAIGTAFGELVRYMLSTAPRGSTEARPNTGTLVPFKRLYRMIHQRIDDIDEIVAGKPFDYEGLGENTLRGSTPEWMDMGMQDVADPQAVADLLRDFYFNGYTGQFEPSKGISPNIQKLDHTSVEKLLEKMEGALESAYKEAEKGEMVAGAIPETTSTKSRRAQPSKSVRNSKKRKARRDAAVDRDAATTASTPVNKRPRRNAKTTKDVDPAVADELKSKSIPELRDMYLAHRGSPTGDQIALEMMAKEKAQPLPPKAVAIPREMQSMREAEIQDVLLDALYENKPEVIDQATYELRRRYINRGRKKQGLPKIQPVFNKLLESLDNERLDNFGVASSDAIPPSSRASVRELLSYITHRDPQVQVAARTMTYRMLNLMGKTVRGTLDETNVMTAGDIAKIAGVEPSDVGTAVFADMRTPEFRKLRTDMRRMAIGLTKGDTSPFDIVHETGHMIVRSGILPQEELNAIREAYRLSNDATKQRIQAAYGAKYANRITDTQDDLLAEEWFSESLAEYMAERVARGDILGAATDGNIGNLKLRNSFDRAIDRIVEYVAYVFNGLVGRNDIKQQFRRLFLYGDMFEQPTKAPLKNLSRSGPAIHPSLAADAAQDSIMSSPKTRLAKIRNFVGNGLSYNDGSDTFNVFYHGTPNGYAFRRSDNPDAVMRSSKSGNYGPGIYLGDNPDVAAQVYARRPTLASLENQIMDGDFAEDLQFELYSDAIDLVEIRGKIARYRRMYSEEMAGDTDESLLADLREALDEFVEIEQSLQDNLTQNGIVPDPMVVPTYVQVKNPADFQVNAIYDNANDPMFRAIINHLNMTDTLEPRALNRLNENFSNGPLNGQEAYKSLVRLFVDSGRNPKRAQAELNETLEDLGYDGMLTTHKNTVDVDGSEAMANFNTYQGSSVHYRGLVVFDPAKVKHIDAEEFDVHDERLFNRATTAMPRGSVGGIVEAIQNNAIEGFKDINPGSYGEALETEGVNSSLTSSIMSMIRGRNLDVKEEQAMRKNGPLGFLQSQSTRMENMGASWIAGWYKNHFPELHQKFAAKYFPIHHALRALPDADGKVRAWARQASAGIGQSQPDSYKRIVRALRYGAGSRQEKALNSQERAIWNQIRTSFSNERTEMIAQGIYVGDRGPNYLPQVWNPEKIRKNKNEFIEKMMRYYKVEKTAKGVMGTDEEARDFATGLFETLADEGADGVYVPIKGGSRNPKFENVDFSRVIELEKYPAMMKELENFLEDDLEFLLVKYFEGSSRRLAHVDKLGINTHAFYDYLMASEQGADGIVRLLSRNKEFRRDVRAIGETGYPEYGTLVDTVRMPFEGNEAEAREFVQRLIAANNEKGSAVARQMLDEIAPRDTNGNISLTYRRRADAIVGSLSDFKGNKANWGANDYEFMENAMRVAMKKPQVGTGSKALSNTSKALRSFNNVTLLGFTTLTSLGDTVLPIIRSGSVSDWAKGLYKWKTDPEYAQMLHDVGVAMENIVHERMIYMYGAVDNKMSNAFFNATMLTPWTDMQRQIAGATGYESLKTMQRKAFKYYKDGADLASQPVQYKTAHRFLRNYGLEDFLPGGAKERISLSDRNLLSEDEAVRTAIIRFADDAIFQPNPNDIPLWAQTPIGGLVFQLKSFPLMMTRLGGHVIREAKQGNLKPLAYMATLGPAFGMATLSAKDIIQMRGGDDEKSPELRRRNLLKAMGYDEDVHGNEDDFMGWYVEGMMVMGGLGLLGDVIHSTVSQVDNGAYGKMRIASTFLGPSFGTGMAAVDVMAGAQDAAFGSTDSNAKERTATRELATRIPVLGGIRRVREGIVDSIAGESGDSSSSNSWSKSWESGWR